MSFTPIRETERDVSFGYTPPPYADPNCVFADIKRINVFELESFATPTIEFPVKMPDISYALGKNCTFETSYTVNN